MEVVHLFDNDAVPIEKYGGPRRTGAWARTMVADGTGYPAYVGVATRYPRGVDHYSDPFPDQLFRGGGTDYPDYIDRHGGAVLGTAIDKSAYLSVSHFFSRLFDYSIRIAYRQVECVRTLAEIQHAPFRECLKYCGISSDVEVNYTGKLPSFSGLGSSSSFVVGLLNALHAFQHRSVRPIDLALQAMEIEQDVLKESVGCQDQTFAAVGGFNVVEFRGRRDLVIHRIPLSPTACTKWNNICWCCTPASSGAPRWPVQTR